MGVLGPLIPDALPGGRPCKTDMHSAMNAILYLLRPSVSASDRFGNLGKWSGAHAGLSTRYGARNGLPLALRPRT